MNAPALRALAEESTAERRRLILDAAERSFTRAGFHRTTMQDVAAEAGMSPGNLYRYFPSKDALVAGLCERDRAGLANEFAEMREAGGDFLDGLPRARPPAFRGQRVNEQGEALPGDLGRGDAQSGDRRAADRVRPQLRRAARRGLRGGQAGRRDPSRRRYARRRLDHLQARRRPFRPPRASPPISMRSARSPRSSPSSARS